MIVVLFGQPCSGKTTLSKKLNMVNIDGDELRELFKNKDYSREGRIKNLNRASDIAVYMENQYKYVSLSLVYPYKEARDYLNSLSDNVVWVYLYYTGERGRENFHVQDFELDESEDVLRIDTSYGSIDGCVNQIKNYIYMQKILAEGNRKTDGYAMFIGRWQPWHTGHRWLIDQQLEKGKKVLLCVRDVPKDDKNPWSAEDIFTMLNTELEELIRKDKLKVMIIPDIESVNFGRGVGYDIIEYTPPQEIHNISATKIREQMKLEGKL